MQSDIFQSSSSILLPSSSQGVIADSAASAEAAEGMGIIDVDVPKHSAGDAQLAFLDDYPEPLTELQRRSFQKHVAFHVRRYALMQRSTLTIRRGFQSLNDLVSRLSAERDRLQGELDSMASEPAAAAANNDCEAPDAKRAKMDTTAQAPSEPESGATTARPRRTGGLLRSAAFANMQRVLQTAQREETAKFAKVSHDRERIGKQTRLNMVLDDLKTQQQHMAPIGEKMKKVNSIESELSGELAPLLQLLHDMFHHERQYASAFFLKAVKSVENNNNNTTSAKGNEEEEGEGALAACVSSATTCCAYDIPFTPAQYTPETEDIIRGQVEEALDDYLTYRARIDPLLRVLDEEREARQKARVEQLLGAIGLGGGGKDVIDLFGGKAAVAPALGNTDGILSVAGTNQQRVLQPGGGISDSDESAEDEVAVGPAAASAAVDRDKQDRQMIQSALTALDDFEEMF